MSIVSLIEGSHLNYICMHRLMCITGIFRYRLNRMSPFDLFRYPYCDFTSFPFLLYLYSCGVGGRVLFINYRALIPAHWKLLQGIILVDATVGGFCLFLFFFF